jgi:F-type H+-transporting ATPase subunit epsilon
MADAESLRFRVRQVPAARQALIGSLRNRIDLQTGKTMAATYTLRIVTHEATVFEGAVESLVAPGALGSLGVLAHHAPLITTLKPGLLKVRDAQGNLHRFQVQTGILEVSNNQAVVLTDDAVPAD